MIRASVSIGVVLSLLSSVAWAKPSREELEKSAVSDAAEAIPLPQSPAMPSPHVAVYGSSLYLTWLERKDMTSGTLQLASWNGMTWSAPMVVAQKVALDVQQAGREPALNRRSDGALVVHWFDKLDDGTTHAMEKSSTDGGKTWKGTTEFPTGVADGSGTVVWLDDDTVAWLAPYKSVVEPEAPAVFVYQPHAKEGPVKKMVMTDVHPTAQLLGLELPDRELVGFRHTFLRTGENGVGIVDLSAVNLQFTFGESDGWHLPDSARGVGPVMALGADGTGVVAYYSERRQGRPAITCFVGPMKKFLTPRNVSGKDVYGFNRDLAIHPHYTVDVVRDLHVHFAPTGEPIVSGIEAGFPTARRADDDDAPLRRLSAQPLGADASLIFAGAMGDRSYFAWTSGGALTIVKTALSGAR